MSDIFEDIPAFQDIKREGFLRGLEEGYNKAFKEAYEEGRLEAFRQAIMHVVEARYPKLLALAKKQTAIIDDPDELDRLIVKISIAQNAREARSYLLNGQEDEDIN